MPPLKILVAEDNPVNSLIAMKFLEGMGHVPTLATTGQEVVERMHAEHFDLVLMEKHRVKDSTPMTPAMALVYALDVQLDRILEEGLEPRFARHAAKTLIRVHAPARPTLIRAGMSWQIY